MAVGGPWESGLGWGPLTNTLPDVLIDPMPSYFHTSARRQGAARRDQQSLKKLEGVGGAAGDECTDGGGSAGFTALRRGGQRGGRGHKFSCVTRADVTG